MRNRLLTILCLITSAWAYSQPYGDEWIDYNKQYFKVGLNQDGIYRLTYDDLVSAGFPVSSVDPRRLQLFYKGNEIAIHVNGQGDAVFNTSDYIEFYGIANDGRSDARLYVPEEAQPHQYYNIYSDSSAYFLTYHLSTTNGKRMGTFDENNTGLPALEAHQEDILHLNVSQYAPGQGYSTDEFTRFTYFDYGEGWTSGVLQEGQFLDNTLAGVVNRAESVGNPQLEVLMVGRDYFDHSVRVSVGPSTAALRDVGTIIFSDFNSGVLNTAIAWSDIGADGSLVVRVTADGTGGNELVSCSYVKLQYPQQFDMDNANFKSFQLPAQTTSKSYIEINNVPSGTQLYDVTDVENVLRIGSNASGSTINAIINNTSVQRQIVANSSGFNTPTIDRARFRKINAAAHNYIIISNKYLMRPTSDVANPVKEYAAYRASDSGGGYDTLVVDAELLANQYNYGLKGPLSVYDFMRFLYQTGSPEYLFIIGKGLEPSANFYRNSNGVFNINVLGTDYAIRDLVPAAGAPGSDIAYTSGLDGGYGPAVPVGRLPARQPQNVLDYLAKVKYMEQLPFDDLWRKRLLHLSGGIRESELPVFRSYMEGFESIAENDYLGGRVKTIAKSTGTAVEFINVADEVNNGLNLITFFGHSSPNITDIDIGFVTDPLLGYDNPGKYPTILVNGCNAGRFFNVSIMFGEDWILAPEKGAIGFIAHSSFGFAYSLRRYSDLFYSYAYGDSVYISKPVADVQDKVAEDYIDLSAINPTNIVQVQQMVLLGDPAIAVFGAELPDYEITAETTVVESFDDQPVNALADSFAIKTIVKNYGRTSKDSVTVRVTRTLSDNSILTYDSLYPPVDFVDTLLFTIRLDEETSFGNNAFRIEIDPDGAVDELNGTNNTATINFFIPLYGTQNLLPYRFGIVDKQNVTLIAQSSNLLEGERMFLFEIDTTSTFDSPYLMTHSTTARTMARWNVDLQPDVSPNDSLVYYWRTRYANQQTGESDEWVTSSFTYIEAGDEGWTQREQAQFANNGFQDLIFDPVANTYEFERTSRTLEITTYGADNPATNTDISVRIDDLEYIINNIYPCRDNTLNLIAFDKRTATPYLPIFNTNYCGRQPWVINSFVLSELENGLDTYMSRVAEGDSVVLFTIGNPQPSMWSSNVKSLLEEVGVATSGIEALADGEPFIAFGRKGDQPGTTALITTPDTPAAEQLLQSEFFFTGVSDRGFIESGLIGPATQWGSLYFNLDAVASDSVSVSVEGYDLSGNAYPLMEGVSGSPTDISGITYPFIRLKMHIIDEVNLDPATLEDWMVTYTPAAEGVLLPIPADLREKQEGQLQEEIFYFTNISDKEFADSLMVIETVLNQPERSLRTSSYKITPPKPNDSTRIDIAINTIGITGLNDFSLSVNPRIERELYYDNNLITYRNFLEVAGDQTDPFIEVLFDGRQIINGDIVSPDPSITIKIRDENPYLRLTDTTSVQLFIKRNCDECSFSRVSFSDDRVNWSAADDDQDFTVEYNPGRLDDGTYTLRITATDKSGNSAGEEPFLISFEVVNESAITNFYPYPNPFSTSTRFIFTLTGTQVPDDLMIQIMTVSGKVVREITTEEIGPVHIGNNMTQYAWDGRDEFGDKLANGVYLYKVFARINGDHIKRRNTSADKAFKNGFGKLYILR